MDFDSVEIDSVEITALISATSICDNCIAYKTGLSVRRVQRVMRTQLTKSLKLATTPGRCGRCLKQTSFTGSADHRRESPTWRDLSKQGITTST